VVRCRSVETGYGASAGVELPDSRIGLNREGGPGPCSSKRQAAVLPRRIYTPQHTQARRNHARHGVFFVRMPRDVRIRVDQKADVKAIKLAIFCAIEGFPQAAAMTSAYAHSRRLAVAGRQRAARRAGESPPIRLEPMDDLRPRGRLLSTQSAPTDESLLIWHRRMGLPIATYLNRGA